MCNTRSNQGSCRKRETRELQHRINLFLLKVIIAWHDDDGTSEAGCFVMEGS